MFNLFSTNYSKPIVCSQIQCVIIETEFYRIDELCANQSTIYDMIYIWTYIDMFCIDIETFRAINAKLWREIYLRLIICLGPIIIIILTALQKQIDEIILP